MKWLFFPLVSGNPLFIKASTLPTRPRLWLLFRFAVFSKNSCSQKTLVLKQLPSRRSHNTNDMLFSLLEAEDDYDESPTLLKKIANYRKDTQFNLLSRY